jgi:shikimate dehydrogenase
MGFRDSLRPLIATWEDEQAALILGTGGAAHAVAYALSHLDIAWRFVSRTPSPGVLAYEDLTLEMIASSRLIVNTTPLGMAPGDGIPPIPFEGISSAHLLYDLVYEPGKTGFLESGEERGAAITNGMEMLVLQAEAAWELWTRGLPEFRAISDV